MVLHQQQQSLKKNEILNLQNEAMLLVKIFSIHNSMAKIFSDKHFLQNANTIKDIYQEI